MAGSREHVVCRSGVGGKGGGEGKVRAVNIRDDATSPAFYLRFCEIKLALCASLKKKKAIKLFQGDLREGMGLLVARVQED